MINNKNEMTKSQANTLEMVINHKLCGGRYVVKNLEVEGYDFCKDVQVSLVIGRYDTCLFDKCFIFEIGPRGGLMHVNKKGNKIVRCNASQLISIW